jgi:hypothetical protein
MTTNLFGGNFVIQGSNNCLVYSFNRLPTFKKNVTILTIFLEKKVKKTVYFLNVGKPNDNN